MFNNNSITAEVRIVREPERSTRVDVVKAGGAIFIGKKDDGKDPIWADIVGWKYQGQCLETVAKNDVLIVTGSLSQESWESNGEKKTKLVITCDTIAKKLWANQQAQPKNQQPPQNSYNQQHQGGGYNSQPQGQGYNQGGYQSGPQGGYNQGRNEGGHPKASGGFNPPPDDD